MHLKSKFFDLFWKSFMALYLEKETKGDNDFFLRLETTYQANI